MISSPLTPTRPFTSSSTISTPTSPGSLAKAPPQRSFPLHANPGLLAQSGGNLVPDPARPVAARCFLYLGQTTQGAHRCLHQGLQHHCRSVCLEQVRGPSETPQTTFRGPMIPGTSTVGLSPRQP